ncbi:hypothetical protein CH302_03055 [Rhodococcus sp. 15-2388-1-1a]|uniref:hypothetical protein n=1 Tax=Nocardiaceae TaxID=85025 RepID=UPI000569594C|nr:MULTISPECIES: hypothetical protein [Rhodococcus]OZF04395.1 hypothetical protein CH302_03055 [Rhodococcus sp. 15-2388-1-1a]
MDSTQLLPSEYDGAYDPNHPLSRACSNLIASVEALKNDFTELQVSLEKRTARAVENWNRARLEYAPESGTGSVDRVQYFAPPAKQRSFTDSLRRLRMSESAEHTFAGNMMLALVAAFDTFESELMRAAFKLRPELLNPLTKSINWADISPLADIEAVRGLFIEMEVESILRSSHAEQIKAIGVRFHLGPMDDFTERESLIEITERRNLYAHQGGRVSAYYISQCGKNIREAPVVGTFLETTSNYYASACEDILTIAVMLTQKVWRSVGGSTQIGKADRDLAQVIYVFLVCEEWAFAARLLKYACSMKKHSSEQHTLVFRVNRAQTFKWIGNQQACESILNTIDWDARDVGLRLSRAVLFDDFAEAGELMHEAGSTNHVRKSAFDHWPVYREFRHSEEFRRVYRDLYQEDAPTTIETRGAGRNRSIDEPPGPERSIAG